MKAVLLLLLLSFSFALRVPDLYGAYPERKKPQTDVYPVERDDLRFINLLYDLYVGGKDWKGSDKDSYAYRAWLFENTMAFVGYFHSTFWQGGNFSKYKEHLEEIREVLRRGRISDEDVETTRGESTSGIKQERLNDYYRAIVIGVLAGGTYGLVPFPSFEQAGKYGKVLSPVFAFRVGQQQLRHAVLIEYAQRLAQRRAELAVLSHYAKNFCTGEVYSQAQLDVGRLSHSGSPVDCCSAIISAVADLKVGVVNALDVLSDQNKAFADLHCATLLAILHTAKVELETAEISLYQLSVHYGILANQEREKAGIK